MTKELKPCPFCGGEAVIFENPRPIWYYGACTKCFCRTGTYVNKQEARDAWNKRAYEKELDYYREAADNFYRQISG